MNSNRNKKDIDENLELVELSPEEKARLDQIQELNIEAIQNLEEFIAKQKKVNQKQVLLKVGIYVVEAIILILITSQISNVFVAIIVSLLGSIIMTSTIDLIIKKIKKEKDIGDTGEIKRDYKRHFISLIVSQFPVIPPIIKNNIVTICYKGKTTKVSADVLKMRTFKKLTEEFLQARKDFRDFEYTDAVKLLKKVIRKSKHRKELLELHGEAELLLDAIPIVTSS
ncbi:hypothetical protein DSAG12_02700 [Promethearchaeum syntrophicum]|uniref:Uncharacterized protein n=1 Tax=Promethearchaeum syntrophicum TaxID=2594042 RepID=A0A5B9DDL3_9ARCH|nr:hypothetical protein [Candidatus Prometheoarchaeum syntrophicum]QEE16870.1 hypothetical protein DSAG12_02700 [Candidatus Prometheoarchaeum syntrophicum]